MVRDGSITVFTQEHAVSYSAYLLEEAANHIFDGVYVQPLAFKLPKQESRFNPSFSLGLEPVILSPL